MTLTSGVVNLSSSTLINKTAASVYGLSIESDGTGKALVATYPVASPLSVTYIGDGGGFFTNAFCLISGMTTGTEKSRVCTVPTSDPFMLGIWSDVNGPSIVSRTVAAGYHFLGMDHTTGNYLFSIETDGKLQWGTGTTSHTTFVDTSLTRSATGVLSLSSKALQLTASAFANLPASPAAGMIAYVNNSSVSTWGGTANGSGSTKVLVWYNGTNWTVIGA